MTQHTYKILDDNTVEMWVPGQSQTDPPPLRQPFHPSSRPWSSREEAENWIINFIAEQTAPVELEEPTELEEPVVE